MKSPSEQEQVLVPRLVLGYPGTLMHICMADDRFAHGAIVTLEALCGVWAFGTLYHTPIAEWESNPPGVVLCMRCVERWMREHV